VGAVFFGARFLDTCFSGAVSFAALFFDALFFGASCSGTSCSVALCFTAPFFGALFCGAFCLGVFAVPLSEMAFFLAVERDGLAACSRDRSGSTFELCGVPWRLVLLLAAVVVQWEGASWGDWSSKRSWNSSSSALLKSSSSSSSVGATSFGDSGPGPFAAFDFGVFRGA